MYVWGGRSYQEQAKELKSCLHAFSAPFSVLVKTDGVEESDYG